MSFTYFSHNGKLFPSEQAVISINNIEYSYGFGVYETIRVTQSRALFVNDHIDRLLESAKIINLEHNFDTSFIKTSINELISKLDVGACNIKILLIGGKNADSANLYILALNPLFPDRKLYKQGAHCITNEYERPFPHAKSLNMLPSYLAYKKAKQLGAYDCLLIDRNGFIVEGTRTNFFTIKDNTIFSPPESEILLGVTRKKVINVAKQNGFEVSEKNIGLDEISNYDGAFLTSTSSKIIPIKSIENYQIDATNKNIHILIDLFNHFLKTQ